MIRRLAGVVEEDIARRYQRARAFLSLPMVLAEGENRRLCRANFSDRGEPAWERAFRPIRPWVRFRSSLRVPPGWLTIAPSNTGRLQAARFRCLQQASNLRGMILLAAIVAELAAFPQSIAAAAESELLDPVAETRIGRIETFIAADAFKIGSRIGGRTLSAIGLNFSQHFLGVVERDVRSASLSGWSLRYTTGDTSLIKALGGEGEAAMSFLAHLHRVMDMGDDGPSHTDWQGNFAYVRSPVDQRLWAVHWTVNYANEWTIGAVYVPHPGLDWRSGSRLFGKQAVPGSADLHDGGAGDP
jgi:hypothetical protein